jgi:hypothetical protein
MPKGEGEMPTKEEEEAKRKADEEEAKRKAAESEEDAGASEDEEELTVEQLKAQLAEKEKHIKSLNKESAERRKKLDEFEKAEQERKQAELTEVEKAQARAKQLEDEKAALAKENQTLKLQREFEGKVRDAKLEFRNPLAAKDAFQALVELMGDETEVTDDHIKRLTKERDYYFGKADTTVHNNDGGQKGKGNKAITSQELVAAKKKKIGSL